jgi:thermitase
MRKILMKRHRLSLPILLLSIVALAASLSQGISAQGNPPSYVPGEVLIGIRNDSSPLAQPLQAIAEVGQVIGQHPVANIYRVRLRPGVSVQNAVARLKQNPAILYAEPNYIRRITATPNDLYYNNGVQYAPQKIQANLAWDIWQPQATTLIAIIDTGVQTNHQDLTNKIYRVNNQVVGYNALNGSSNANDDHGHGTHCAGIAAAQINNSIGIAGIAGWNGQAGSSDTTYIKIMPVKVLDSSGSGTDAGVADGIIWATDRAQADGLRLVISLSLGSPDYSTALNNAVQYAFNRGVVVVAAAGNNGSNSLFYPAAFNNVISVASTTSTDTLSSFSNYGSWVKIAAPGSSIASTYYSSNNNNSYAYMSGTSMACPHVVGVAGLILSQYPTRPNTDVVNNLLLSTDPYTPFNGRTIGGGRVNAFKALNGSMSTPPAPTNLTATAGNAQVSLQWQPGSESLYVTYNVKRSTTAGSPYTTIATGITVTSFVDTSVVNGTTYYYVVSASAGSVESANSNEASGTPSGTAQPIRINSGGPQYVSPSFGNTFLADTYFTGGLTTTYSTRDILNTTDDPLYLRIRYGTSFGYAIPVPNGNYTLRLHFAECYYTSANQRRFNVTVNGTQVLSNYDIFAAAGGINRAVVVSVPVTVTNGAVNINFATTLSGRNATISAIELTDNSAPSPPPPPANLVATAGNGQVSLAWGASSDATSYNVKRSTTAGGPYTTIATGIATTNYLDNAVTNGTTYYYVVSGVNAAGEGPNSNEASATPLAPPPAPTNLTATAGNAQVTLSWTAAPTATSYNVKRSTTAGGPYTTIATGVTTTNYVDNTVTNGTTYYYVVSGVNAAGEGPNSNEANATPQQSDLPTVRINSGGPQYVSPSFGNTFLADTYFTGGLTTTYSTRDILNTTDDPLYLRIRYGASFGYAIPVPNGNYTLRLHFAECYYTSANQRRFNVTVNGTQVLSNYDIFAAAGGINRAVVVSVPVTVTNGAVNINFATTLSGRNATISAIELVP